MVLAFPDHLLPRELTDREEWRLGCKGSAPIRLALECGERTLLAETAFLAVAPAQESVFRGRAPAVLESAARAHLA